MSIKNENDKPMWIEILGDRYKSSIVIIAATDDQGRPTRLVWLHDDQTYPLEPGDRFAVAYMPVQIFKMEGDESQVIDATGRKVEPGSN